MGKRKPKYDSDLDMLNDIVRRLDKQRQDRLRHGRWGRWRWNPRLKLLIYVDRQFEYVVDLPIQTSEEILRWVAHLWGKDWARPDFMSFLVALEDITGRTITDMIYDAVGE